MEQKQETLNLDQMFSGDKMAMSLIELGRSRGATDQEILEFLEAI